MVCVDRVSVTSRRLCLILYWIAMYILTHWPEIDRYKPPGWDWPDADKLVHASMYAGWGVLWFWLLVGGGKRVTRQAIFWLIVGGAAYGMFDELTQGIVDRTPDVWDWACDMAGLLAGLAIMRAWQRRRMPLKPAGARA